jgi:predicted metal-dependent phosphoesterase TrpH
LIDLHTHTTASDGHYPPAELVSRAARAGVRTLAVTDHDTIAGCDEAAGACSAAGIEFVTGIEITAVTGGVDVHVLGYFFDRFSPPLAAFLTAQRQERVERLRRIGERLASHGIVLDLDAILQPALDNPALSPGRPWVARALVSQGHAADIGDAFNVWLSRGRPGFVARAGAPPSEVFQRIHEAGGLASIAHPAHLADPGWITDFAADGLDAVEAYHSDHDQAATAQFLAIARDLGLAVSGGSDFHGEGYHSRAPGSVSLPAGEFARLRLAAAQPRRPSR